MRLFMAQIVTEFLLAPSLPACAIDSVLWRVNPIFIVLGAVFDQILLILAVNLAGDIGTSVLC